MTNLNQSQITLGRAPQMSSSY